MFLEFATLKFIWWLLLGVLLVGFAVMDGFDLGVGILLPFLGRTDSERRVIINTVGPVWEGNQVWLILGGGAIFAAWPALYAASFSGFYLAMLLVLAALIVRPVGFKFRSKMPQARWRGIWDWALFVSGLVPSLVFGVAMGNLLEGVPFTFDAELRATYAFGLLDLLNPFALLCGLVSVAMLTTHGAAYLAVKTQGIVAQRARAASRLFALAWTALFGLMNYRRWPWVMLLPVIGLAAPLLVAVLAAVRQRLIVFVISALGIAGVIGTMGVSLFPFLLPSSSNPGSSLTVWDASSSHRTLGIMLIAVLLILPVVLAYTSWVYHVLRGPVTAEQIQSNPDGNY